MCRSGEERGLCGVTTRDIRERGAADDGELLAVVF